MSQQKIVVGYNGTSSALEAVMWAADEAKLLGAPLHITTCFDLPVMAAEASIGWGAGTVYDAIRTDAAGYAEQILASVSDVHPALTVTSEVLPGPASNALLDQLDPGDLVVVGASGHDGAAAFWLGSTPRHLVRHSPCPVAVIRTASTRGTPDRIVVGIDGSEASDAAVDWAADEADRHGCPLVLVHGWSYPYRFTDTGSTQARELTQIDAECTLDRSVEAARERCGVDVTGELVEDGAASALLAAVVDGDLLVVGSRGRGDVRSSLFGSTANSVLDGAAVPVIVIRAADDETPDSGPTSKRASLAST